MRRAACSQRNANQPPAATAAPRLSSQNQRSAGSAKEPAQIHVAALLLGELEERGLLEVELPGDDQVREGLQPDVVQVDALVVELAPVGDGLLELGDARLQMAEARVRFELRILLRHREQAAEPGAQLLLGGAPRRDA